MGKYILLFIEGIAVGFGAIMPGISGAALCAAFGMYKPLMALLSHPKVAIKESGVKLLSFLGGAAVGFVGLSSIAAYLMEKDSAAVTCVFIGFVLGTMPSLWHDAGEKGRSTSSFVSLASGFVILLGLLFLLANASAAAIAPNASGYIFCGILWGISFIVPGLSSSTLLIFFGLYQPMLEGISKLSASVVLPLAVGMAICLLALPRAVNAAYKRFYPQLSHFVVGFVAASMVSIVPIEVFAAPSRAFAGLLFVALGAALSLGATHICAKLK